MNRYLEPRQIPADAIVIDARPRAAYDAGHIPGARHAEFLQKFFIRTPEHLEAFGNAVQDLARASGLNAGQRVVVYDAGRDTRGARLAWALEYAGFDVALLRDGWNAWTGEIETVPPQFNPSEFTLEHPRREVLATVDDLRTRGETTLVVDTRNAQEFSGAQRPPGATRGGHIKGAINLNWENLETATGLKDDAALESELKDIPKDAEVIVHCQSGARSAVVYHALKARGVRVRNYVGSMNEWANDPELPLEADSNSR
jgi:thiosulfate/3-mercaptopyruvate sulfurtransferase